MVIAWSHSAAEHMGMSLAEQLGMSWMSMGMPWMSMSWMVDEHAGRYLL